MFPPKVDVLDEPSKEVWLVQLNEADVLRILAEILVALLRPYFRIRPCRLEQTRLQKEIKGNTLLVTLVAECEEEIGKFVEIPKE